MKPAFYYSISLLSRWVTYSNDLSVPTSCGNVFLIVPSIHPTDRANLKHFSGPPDWYHGRLREVPQASDAKP